MKGFYVSAIINAKELLPLLKPTPYEQKHMLLMVMYMRSLEIAGSIQALDEPKSYNAASILIRSLLELHFDFLMVFTQEDYYLSMRLNEITAEIKIAENMNDSKEVIKLETEMENIKNKGIKKYTVFQRCEFLAKTLEDETYNLIYQTVYRSLCAETHNSSQSMLESHLKKHQDNFITKEGTRIPESRLELFRKQIGLSVLMQSRILHRLYRTGKDIEFERTAYVIPPFLPTDQ